MEKIEHTDPQTNNLEFAESLKPGELLVVQPDADVLRVNVTTVEGVQLGFNSGATFKVIANEGGKITLQLIEENVMSGTKITVDTQNQFWHFTKMV